MSLIRSLPTARVCQSFCSRGGGLGVWCHFLSGWRPPSWTETPTRKNMGPDSKWHHTPPTSWYGSCWNAFLLIHSLVRSFIHSFIHLFLPSFIPSFFSSLFHFIHYIPSPIPLFSSFIHSIGRSFVYLSLNIAWWIVELPILFKCESGWREIKVLRIVVTVRRYRVLFQTWLSRGDDEYR